MMVNFKLSLSMHLWQDCEQDKSVQIDVHVIISAHSQWNKSPVKVTEFERKETLSCYLLSEAHEITEELKVKYKRMLGNLAKGKTTDQEIEITLTEPIFTVKPLVIK